MAVFNQTLYDLNNKRYYIGAYPDVSVPLEVISDLKLSVPDLTSRPSIQGVYLKNDVIRILISNNGRPVASFVSDSRLSVRRGVPLALKSLLEGYAGFIVFGDGVHYDFTEACSFPISEECLTRFRPSRIPYAARPCSIERLTGAVHIYGGVTDAYSRVEDISNSNTLQNSPEGRTHGKALVIALNNTGELDPSNPVILYANGINRLANVNDVPSPIYSIAGIAPNCGGRIHLQFSDKFVLGSVADTTGLAVGVTFTQDDVCDKRGDEPDPLDFCPPGSFQVSVIAVGKDAEPGT
jgi:hypothetical protein